MFNFVAMLAYLLFIPSTSSELTDLFTQISILTFFFCIDESLKFCILELFGFRIDEPLSLCIIEPLLININICNT